MSSRIDTASRLPDPVKWAASAAILIAALGAFYYFQDLLTPVRVLIVLVGAIVSVWVAVQTETGRAGWNFVLESRTEVRKVVWPTRRETLQTTGLVIGMVAIVAVILWSVDSLLGMIMRSVMSAGG